MVRGIVGVTPSVYAVLDPLRPAAFADSAEESLGCRQSMLILVWSTFGGTLSGQQVDKYGGFVCRKFVGFGSRAAVATTFA